MDNRKTLLFTIKPSSGVPIYRQIIEQMTRLVISGYLKSGDELPSVRQVAGELEINPMTVSKAYSMLEVTGILRRVRGIGMIVSADREQDKRNMEKRLELIRPVLIEAATQAKQLGLPGRTVLEIFNKLLEENKCVKQY